MVKSEHSLKQNKSFRAFFFYHVNSSIAKTKKFSYDVILKCISIINWFITERNTIVITIYMVLQTVSVNGWVVQTVLHGDRCIFVCWFDRRCTNNKLTINYLLLVTTDKKCWHTPLCAILYCALSPSFPDNS